MSKNLFWLLNIEFTLNIKKDTLCCIHLRGTPMPIKPIRTESAQAWAQTQVAGLIHGVLAFP